MYHCFWNCFRNYCFINIFLCLFISGWALGDPHFTTLDSKEYTFNGHGEYVLIRNTDENVEIQCRTDRAVRQNGNLSEATVFTAFVVSGPNVWFQAELNAAKNGMTIYAGASNTSFDDFSRAFDENTLEGQSSQVFNLERDNYTITATFIDLGKYYSITCIQRPLKGSNESGLLQQVVF